MPELDKTKRMDLAGTQAMIQDTMQRFNKEVVAPMSSDVNALKGKVPSEASAQNQLADKAYVSSMLGPTYDEDDECIEFPINSAASYDAEDECVEIG